MKGSNQVSKYLVTVSGGSGADITEGILDVASYGSLKPSDQLSDSELRLVYETAVAVLTGSPSGSSITLKIQVP
jgi:hypothetical protein